MFSKVVQSLFVVGLVVVLSEAAAEVLAAPAPQMAPPNPDFIAYQKQLAEGKLVTGTAEGFGLGWRPSPVDLSHATGGQVVLGGIILALPTSYDLRTITNKLPPVRNQGTCGDCWAFATYGSLESWLRPTETTWDFAEMDMNCSHGFDWSACSGGNRGIATAFLSRWDGPVVETCYPHGTTCTSPRPSCARQKRALDVVFIPDRGSSTDNDNIKNAVMTYGAVYTTMCWSDPSYRSATASYYYTGSSVGNHAVCIVGWDDNYSRTQFNSPYPAANGAFIVRNSWGSSWGASGYFYISYYDTKVGIENGMFINAVPTSDYTRIYEYDPYGWLYGVGYGANTAWESNIFTAVASESVKAVGFYTPTANANYQLYVYTGCSSGAPRSGTLAASTSGTLANIGYHTVSLPTPANVTSGQRFSVVLSVTTPGYNYPVCMEGPYSGYCSAPTAGSGQSFISYDGNTWADLTSYYSNYNVCAKALMGPVTDTTPPTVNTVFVGSPWDVDITFSEPMGSGVTTAGNYTLSGTGQGTLTANPSSVGLITGNTYRLHWTGGEMKNAGNITVCVSSNVKDLAGNSMGSPNCGTHVGGGIGTPPTIHVCSLPRLVNADNNCQGPVADFTGSSSGLQALDNVTPPHLLVVTQIPPIGTMVGLGLTNVTVTVTDQAGNSSSCPTFFSVVDPDGDNVCGTNDLCPNSIPGAQVDSTGCSNGPGDMDQDGDVDSDDLQAFIACSTGAEVDLTAGCERANLDSDSDVDVVDFGMFQRCLSGANSPSSLTCAD